MFIIRTAKRIEAIVDDCDADLANRKWFNHAHGYLYRNEKVAGRTVSVLLHRIILERKLGRALQSNEHCDHCNGVPLDNRRDNLRVCTHTQNMQNKKSSNKSVGLKGVSKIRNRYQARIRVNGKQINLGVYASAEEAHHAYSKAAVKYHGEFARTD
jgi:hypothetical protein